MPAGVSRFISFHIRREANISQCDSMISHFAKQNISLKTKNGSLHLATIRQVTDKAYIGKHSPIKCTNSFIHFLFDTGGTKRKFPKRNAKRGISPVATGDQRPTALDPCRLLKKSGENFVYFVSGNMFVGGLRGCCTYAFTHGCNSPFL